MHESIIAQKRDEVKREADLSHPQERNGTYLPTSEARGFTCRFDNMLLSDKRILEEMKNGNIVIDPFDPKCLNTNSYDCRLGEYYYQPNNSMLMVSVDCAEDIKQYWGSPQRTDLGILVHPGTTVLAHTQEIVGGKSGYVAYMKCRSTIARFGLSVCKCAGVGDVSFINKWCMEISNHTRTAIYLPINVRICQFEFYYVGETLKEYHGNYGQGKWTPLDLLPKAQTDFVRV